jgi:hypothetical protein
MTRTLAFVLTVLALAGGPEIFGQRARPGAAAPPVEKVEIISDLDPEADFAEKGLPEPAIIGLNPSDELAATLARDIAKYDDRSLPLLIGTLQKAGFYIIDKNEKILYTPVSGDGIGLAFYDFEVAGMLKASKLGTVTTLAKLTDIISTETKDLTSAEMSEAILRDLRSANRSANPQVRFAVSLIFEFGKTFPKPVDLRTVSPQNAVVNIIQASLIERLILGDLLTAYGAFMEQTSVFRQRELFGRPPDMFAFVNAAYIGRGDSGCPNIDDLSKVQKYSKNAAKVVKTINIFRELATKWGVNVKDIKLPGSDMSGGRFKDFAKGVSKANAVLSWVKLVVGMMRLKAKIDVQDPMPLERVKHSFNPGGKERTVTAYFTMDIPDSDSINCAAKVLGLATGLSFSVPKNGPFADKPVTWEIVAHGTRETKYTGTPVYIRSSDDKRPDVSKQVTNAAGESAIVLTGKPQKVDMTNMPVIPIPKRVDLRLSIAMENMKLGDDAPKLGGFFGGLVSADPLAVFSIIPEVLSKIKFSTFGARIPVRDWQLCTEDWGGEIIYKRVFSKTIVVRSSTSRTENSTGEGVRQILKWDEAIITLNPREPEEIKLKPPNPADIIARGKYLDIFEGKREADPCCGPEEGTYATTFRSGSEESYSHVIQRIVPIAFRGTERDYSVGIDLFTDMMTSRKRDFYEIVGSNCPMEFNEAKSDEHDSMVMIQASLDPGRYPDRFVNSVGDLLKGTKTFVNPDGATVTWQWSLARCKF